MFPEYRELITKLKGSDAHFTRLFDKHNDMDQLIKNMETLKKEKLQLKDRIYAHLRSAEGAQA
jgi:uncharacterized protein YdcH (DUF465 family)